MIIFGITGGTGAGKSSVSEIFRNEGIYVIDADKTARTVVEPGKPCLKELCDYFGSEIIDENGMLLRRRLADIAFSDAEKHKVLNKITHKYIYEEIKAELERVNPDIAAIDAAVLIGSGIEAMCSFIVSVIADDDVRLRRIIGRDGISEQAALTRLRAQPGKEFYISHSEYIINNNGSAAELEKNAKEVLRKIRETDIE